MNDLQLRAGRRAVTIWRSSTYKTLDTYRKMRYLKRMKPYPIDLWTDIVKAVVTGCADTQYTPEHIVKNAIKITNGIIAEYEKINNKSV